MLKLTKTVTLYFTAFTLTLVTESVIAAKEKFVDVGPDVNGKPVILDVTKIQGSEYKLLSPFGNRGIIEYSFDARCTAKKIFLVQTAIYNGNGQAVYRENDVKEVSATMPNSPAVRASKIVCR